MKIRIRNNIDALAAWWAGYFTSAVKHSGLSGSDGSMSFSKTFDLLVLVSYYFNTNLPPSVAITLIMSAHGTKVLLEGIRSGMYRLSVRDELKRAETQEFRTVNENKTVTTHNIEERIGWDTEREFQAS